MQHRPFFGPALLAVIGVHGEYGAEAQFGFGSGGLAGNGILGTLAALVEHGFRNLGGCNPDRVRLSQLRQCVNVFVGLVLMVGLDSGNDGYRQG